MINLLPPDVKQSYRYARHNRRLAFWMVAFLIAIVSVAGITGSGLFIMDRSIANHKSDIAKIDARLASQNLAGTEKEVTTISNGLKLMVSVLSKQVVFSKLLAQLGNITPSNVILTNISISQTGGAIDITARAASYNAAAQLQANLADPQNKVFSKADMVTVSCASGTDPISADYPCTATIRALFANDNPFLFINTNKAGQ